MAEFASLTDQQKTYMERVQIGDFFVTRDQATEIEQTFELAGKTTDELTAIRNAVVRYLSELTGIARTCGNVKSYSRYHNALSGITAVIDRQIFV